MEGRGDSLDVDEAFTAALSLMIGRHAGSDVSGRRIGREAVPIRRARRLLADKFMPALTLKELAESAGFSRFPFLRPFRRAVGVTPPASPTGRPLPPPPRPPPRDQHTTRPE